MKSKTGPLLQLVQDIASLTIDGDIIAGEEFYEDGNDDDVEALYEYVHRAREPLGIDDPKNVEVDDDERHSHYMTAKEAEEYEAECEIKRKAYREMQAELIEKGKTLLDELAPQEDEHG